MDEIEFCISLGRKFHYHVIATTEEEAKIFGKRLAVEDGFKVRKGHKVPPIIACKEEL